MTDPSKDSDFKLVEKHVNELSDHFDSVQIFVTRQENSQGGTINVSTGAGNWFARLGQIQTWITKGDEYSRLEAREKNKED